MYTFISGIVTLLLIVYVVKMVQTKDVKRWSIKGVFGGPKKYYLIAIILFSIIAEPFAPKQNKNTEKNISEPKTNKVQQAKKSVNEKKDENSEKNKSNKKTDDKKVKEESSADIVKRNKEVAMKRNKDRSLTNEAAKYFGTVPVDKLQDDVGSLYSSVQVSPSQMGYGYQTEVTGKKQTLIRVDDTQTRITNVYLYDKNNPDFNNEELLYTGQTIQNKPKTTYVYY